MEKKVEKPIEKLKKKDKMYFDEIYAFAKSQAGTGPEAVKCMKAMLAEYNRIEFRESHGISHGKLVQARQLRSNPKYGADRARGAAIWQVAEKVGDKMVPQFDFNEKKKGKYPLYVMSSDFTKLGHPIDWEDDFTVSKPSTHPVKGPEWDHLHTYRHKKAARLGCLFCRV